MTKRIVTSLAGAALLIGAVGCGSAGVEQGTPPDLTPGAPPDPSIVSPTGRMGTAAANKAATANSQPSGGGAAPAEKK